jgi:hypothetical protein
MIQGAKTSGSTDNAIADELVLHKCTPAESSRLYTLFSLSRRTYWLIKAGHFGLTTQQK